MMQHFADAYAGLAGLLIFFGFFVAMLFLLFRPGAKDTFEKYGNIPFKDGDDE